MRELHRYGVRLNTREVRAKELLTNRKLTLIEELIKGDPTYRPPPDYRQVFCLGEHIHSAYLLPCSRAGGQTALPSGTNRTSDALLLATLLLCWQLLNMCIAAGSKYQKCIWLMVT